MLHSVEQYIMIMRSCPVLPGQLVSIQELERTRARLQQAHDVGNFRRKGPCQVPKAFNFVLVCLKINILDYVGNKFSVVS